MTTFTVTALVNVGRNNFDGYTDGAPLARVDYLTERGVNRTTFAIKATGDLHATEGMWVVGNRMGCDIHGYWWPADVRSLSVGDVLAVSWQAGAVFMETWYSIESVGLCPIGPPTNVVPLAGTSATSRTADPS